MKIRHALLTAALICTLFAISTPPALACGPSFVLPIFSFDARPERFDAFAKGNIGIVQPSFYRSALFVSYRLFNNQPFSDAEQQDLIRNWQAEYEIQDKSEEIKNAAINNWLDARKKIATNEQNPQITIERNNPDSYNSFLNCTASAFDTAVNTLNARLEHNKTDDVNIKSWLQGQDLVFANCAETKEIPSEVGQDAPDWLKQDRAYQIAAAYFYAMQYDEAKNRFNQIANNTASPWHDIAALLLARIPIRQASNLLSDNNQRNQMLSFYKEAEQQLNKILADNNLKSVHEPARDLLDLVLFRLNPEVLNQYLAKRLTDGTENHRLFQNLTDYRRLLDKAVDGYSEEDKALYPKFKTGHDLTDWVFTVQSKEKDAFSYALEKWQNNKTTAWLMAALIKANPDSPELNSLITAAKAIEKTSPAFLTANYHIIRLQTAQGQTDEARKLLDAILADNSLAINVSAMNLLLAERLVLSNDIAEFIKFSQRQAVKFAYDASEVLLVDVNAAPEEGFDDYTKLQRSWQKRMMFDEDATRIMNTSMPLSVLKQIALNHDLPDYLRSRVALSAWMRAVILNDEETAEQLSSELAKLIPELKTLLATYNKAKTGKAKTYEAIWCMLKNPAMRPLVDSGIGRFAAFNEIENFRNNWWCSSNYLTGSDDTTQEQQMTPPVFLTKDERAKANEENAKIKRLAPSGSDFLAIKTSQWAEFAPKEKRLPEALALAVKATRYGCDTCNTTKASKAAFDILSKNFANTEWKKETPYWFKGIEECDVKQ